jgi:3-deoxy-D-manno-octulosonic acid kinase
MVTTPAPSESRQSFRDAEGTGAIVFDPHCLRQATPARFDAASYGKDAAAVSGQGGRGAAWFVRGEFGEAVLRHYRRGGWMARLSADVYAWQGEAKVRSVAEFRLLQRLRAAQLPVPMPIAARYRRAGLGYRADLLVARIPQARSFADLVQSEGDAAPWAAVGAAIAFCHRRGAHHADLNAHNLLLDRERRAWLIDWDKGRVESGAGEWCQAVIDRLERSLRKLATGLSTTELEQGLRLLRRTHELELRA